MNIGPYTSTRSLIVLALTLCVAVVTFGSALAYFKERSLEAALRDSLELERATLSAIVEVTDRNGVDAELSVILEDCPRRAEYERSLVDLSTLDKQELITAQGLFESCGSIDSLRKSLMVAKLTREYRSYVELEQMLSQLTKRELDGYQVGEWGKLVETETTRADLIAELTMIQGKIIALLVVGSTDAQWTIASLVEDARNVSERLTAYDATADSLRESLIN